MRFVVIAVLVLFTSLAWAGDPATHVVGAGTAQTQWEPGKDLVLKWLQEPGAEILVTSQDFYDYGILSESADDFPCEDPRPIVAVDWWGGYWNYVTPHVFADYFIIRFYSDVPGPPFSHPGDPLYEEACYVYAETWESGVEPEILFYHYFQELTVPFEQVPGNIYWLTVQAIYPYATGGQWGWRVSDDHWNDYCAFKSLYFAGDDAWHDGYEIFADYYDLAFSLYVDDISPVEATSWSGIKAMFR